MENGEVEGAAAKVIDGNLGAVGETLEPVGKGGGGRFAQDALDGEAGKLTCFARRGALRIVEVGGDGDDGAVDRGAEAFLGDGFQLLENLRGNFLGCQGATSEGDRHRGSPGSHETLRSLLAMAPTDETLHR